MSIFFVDNYFDTRMYDAAESGDLERVELLLGQGVNKNNFYMIYTGINPSRRTALWIAAMKGHLPVVQFLVEQGADMESACDDGATPLMVASEWGHLEVVRYLLEQAADRDKAASYGMTSLHLAAIHDHLEIAMLLMSYGANLSARNSRRELPIDVARSEEMKQAIRDEPRRRVDHGHKRATEQDRHPNATASASAQQDDGGEEVEDGERKQSNEERCLNQGVVTEEEAKILAEINEDSEPSDEDDD